MIGESRRAAAIASAAYLVCLIGFAVHYMWPSLFRVWFFNSDEYVFAIETIRFTQLDFQQRFFDMPGTPLMLVASLLWAGYYGLACAFGFFSASRGIAEFTFERVPNVFVLLRSITLVSYCVSLVLMFRLAARLMNRPAAWVATFILAMSPVYVTIASFVRVEPLSICFMLGGFLVLVRTLDSQEAGVARGRGWHERIDPVVIAGVLMGLGAATRMHTLTAAVPAAALLIALAARAPAPTDYPRWIKTSAILAILALGAAWVATGVWPSPFDPFWRAYHAVRASILGGLAALLIAGIVYAIPFGRRLLIGLIRPELIRLLVGAGVGFLAGTPTIIRQYSFFLMTVETYSTYTDLDRLGWPFWKNVRWYLNQYFSAIAPDRLAMTLLVVGAVFVVVRRDRRLLPFLAGALAFFVSKPLSMIAAPHHVLPWLPFYALVCSYPAAVLVELGWRRVGRTATVAVFLLAFGGLALAGTHGPEMLTRDPGNDERLANIQRASDWIVEQTDPRAHIAVGYYCFNPGIFYTWLRVQGVHPPPSMTDRRDYLIWWYGLDALQSQTGYACMTDADLDLAAKQEAHRPGAIALPRSDPRFQLVQTFGAGPNQVNLFRYDLTHTPSAALDGDRSAGGGVRVVAATYGENCKAPHGNNTAAVARACDGRAACDYEVAVANLGDPAPGCGKNFVVEWSCGDSPTIKRAVVGGPDREAGYGLIATLSCGTTR